jgi:hypothetical protein
VLTVVPDLPAVPPLEGPSPSPIDQIVREGARAAHRGDQRRGGRGHRATSERQVHRPGRRPTDAVLLGDLAAVGAQDPAADGYRCQR